MISQPTSLRQFSPRLEAIRGIAALMVALSHSMGAVLLTTPVDHWLKQASNILGNGAAGVSIFFVLSGHVLGLSLGGGNMHPIRYWPIFMLRRVLRIYPAMLVCLTACIAYLAWLYEPSQFSAASSDYYEYWHYKVDWEKYYKNILLIDNAINPVTWTLQVEILGAVALPFFYVIKIAHPVASRFLLGAWLLYFFMIPNMYSYARTGFLYMFLVLSHFCNVG
jgi:exopolysaccharide production protein ExoZ